MIAIMAEFCTCIGEHVLPIRERGAESIASTRTGMKIVLLYVSVAYLLLLFGGSILLCTTVDGDFPFLHAIYIVAATILLAICGNQSIVGIATRRPYHIAILRLSTCIIIVGSVLLLSTPAVSVAFRIYNNSWEPSIVLRSRRS